MMESEQFASKQPSLFRWPEGGADASLVCLVPDAEGFALLDAEERRLDLWLAALPLRRGEPPAVDFRIELLKLKRDETLDWRFDVPRRNSDN